MGDHDALLFANEVFYRAFADRDMTVMQAIWSDDAPIACVHPGWNPLFGRDDVIDSWHGIFSGPNPPAVECIAPHPTVFGNSGIVICYERIGDDYLIATNVFVRRGQTWMLVHHQAGPVSDPPPAETESAPQRRFN